MEPLCLTGPMLMDLVKRSSAWMCSYSSCTALPLRPVLWWASYTFMNTGETRRLEPHTHTPAADPDTGQRSGAETRGAVTLA